MKKNPQTPKIILFASKVTKVQNNRQYLIITDKGVEQHKINDKRQPLWALFQNAQDAEPFMLIFETYNNVQYVADARPITDDLLKRAVQDITYKLHDAQSEERNRSTALSYSKDLVVADKEHLQNIYIRAGQNYKFIKGIDVNETDGTEKTEAD